MLANSGVSASPSGTALLTPPFRPLPALSTLEQPSSSSLLTKCFIQTSDACIFAFYRYKSATGAVFDRATGLLRTTSTQFANNQLLFSTAGGRTLVLTANAETWPRTLNTFIAGSRTGFT